MQDYVDPKVISKGVTMKLALETIVTEGIVIAVAGDILRDFTDVFSEMKGWTEGIETKRRHIQELSDETIQWLKDEHHNNKNLSLDMGSLKTWMKTSETFFWRYYFVLNDQIYNEMVKDLKRNEITRMEYLTDVQINDRSKVTRMLDSVKTINDLIVVVEKYRSRCDHIFALMKARKSSVKGFPFQVMLLGLIDLNRTVKKIVNLAV